jgi:DNA (cytosine-5)-methyltransferase 1
MNTMHLFAGVGGGLLADLILGHKPIIAVEWDKYACRILRERAADGWFPDLSVWEGDVRLFDPSEYSGRVDCIHAGFPCQDISVAGKQAGLGEGTRSGLYREILRIAGVVRPSYLFLENVSAILSMGLGTVLYDLSEMGYDTKWLTIRASDVGAPHGRDRWFALAERTGLSPHAEHNGSGRREQQQEGIGEAATMGDPKHNGQPAAEVSESVGTRSDYNQTWTQPASEFTRPSEQHADVADPAIIGQSGSGEYERQVNSTADCNRETNRIINDGEAGQGWWELEPDVGRVAYAIPNRVHRLKGLGNAQVPLQAAVAFRLLIG